MLMSNPNIRLTSSEDSVGVSLQHIKTSKTGSTFYLLYALESLFLPCDGHVRIFLVNDDPSINYGETISSKCIAFDKKDYEEYKLSGTHSRLQHALEKTAISFVLNQISDIVSGTWPCDWVYRGIELFNEEEKQKVLKAVCRLELSDAIVKKVKQYLR